MKNSIRTTAFLFFLLALVLACTKEIILKTEVEFSLTEQHRAEGYINEDLPTAITVVPEEIIEEFFYSYSYSVSKGKGHFKDDAGKIFPQNEYIAFNPLSASVIYVGSESGEHIVQVIASDNYGFTESVEIVYTLAEIPPVIWTATSPVKRIELGDTAQITINFEKSEANSDANYKRRYRVVAGSGTLDDLSEPVEVDSDGFEPIVPGTYSLNFTPQEVGIIKLSFDLKGNDGAEFTAELDFEVLAEIVDTVVPEITLLGDNPLTVESGNNYKDPGVQALDDVDGDITGDVVVDASGVDISSVGSYQVTYNVSDSSGNAAVEVVRTVEVITGDNPQSPENDILAFAIPGQEEIASIDEINHTVTVNVPSGTETNAAPIALSVSPDASVSPSQNETQDFEYPIIYLITAENGDQQEWTVTVNVAPSADKSIEKFTIAGVDAVILGTQISVTLPAGSNEKSLSPTIVHTGEVLSPDSGLTIDFTDQVTFTVTAENGTQKEYTASVIVQGDKPTARASANTMVALINQDIYFTGSTSTDDISIEKYEWNFGDGNTNSSPNPVHGYSEHGRFTVTLTITDDGGLTDTVSFEVEVPNVAPTARASANLTTVDTGETINFTGSTSSDDAGIVSYHWDFGDGNSSTIANPDHIYTEANLYTVTLRVTDGGGLTNDVSLNFIVNVPNRPPLAVASSNKTSGPNILTVNFNGTGSSDPDGDILTFNWDFGDGSTSTQSNPSHDFAVTGNYDVQLTVSDGDITATDNIAIRVDAFNRLTGRYSAPAGSLVTVKITSIGNGKGSANLKANSGSGETGNEFIRLNTSWNGLDEGSTFLDEDEDNFVMPPSGVVYFFGRHSEIVPTSQTHVGIINSTGSTVQR